MLRIIGDVHGKYSQYVKIALGSTYSVQLGDMGFSYNHFQGLSPERHVFFGGNHDNYDRIEDCPNYIGDYGYCLADDVPGYFFLRGAYSVDKMYRMEGRDWWSREELSLDKCRSALEMYKTIRPKIMITHDCPDEVAITMLSQGLGMGLNKIVTRTGQLLQACFDEYQPEQWIFGHWHKSFQLTLKGTNFRCLKELEYLDLSD
jgi:hypothetical protein